MSVSPLKVQLTARQTRVCCWHKGVADGLQQSRWHFAFCVMLRIANCPPDGDMMQFSAAHGFNESPQLASVEPKLQVACSVQGRSGESQGMFPNRSRILQHENLETLGRKGEGRQEISARKG